LAELDEEEDDEEEELLTDEFELVLDETINVTTNTTTAAKINPPIDSTIFVEFFMLNTNIVFCRQDNSHFGTKKDHV